MATVDLYEFAQVVLNGAGAGTVKLGPLSDREVWSPLIAFVQVSTAVSEATATVYVGHDTSRPYAVDASFAGSSGDSTARVAGKQVRSGQYVFAAWTGGDPGATATLTVNGTKDV